ncbi:hypothetical protein [Serratia sp. Tan611]|uniref:hypothetical protein n=1 Tax=Serratia sp. Tan611 TaxID=2773264 RepID=UPI0019321434|nr:hypothetical protein [Serratia sp. Tan611]CAE1149125.1 conserved exported protein of unknown function [Serratia sp. Tan611]
MKIKISLVAFLMILIPIAVVAANRIEYQDKPTEDAANLVTKYTLSGDEERGEYLKQLEEMTVKHPGNNNVRNMYANILLAEKNYPMGLEQLKVINKDNPKPGSKLTECMLMEKTGESVGRCYQDAVCLFEKSNNDDDNYILALYLADDPKFEVEKNKLVSSGRLTDAEKKILSLSRNELIGSVLP